MGDYKNLLLYGLQRSGTNFLESLIKKKFRVQFLNNDENRNSPLHKHFRLYDDKDIIPEPQYLNELRTPDFESFKKLLEVVPDYYLVISKDPYSWFLSYNKWAKKCNWPKVKHHYILEYNLFYGKWLEFSRQTEKIIFIRYIDLLRDADKELNQLESRMKLRRKIFHRLMSRSIVKVNQSERFSNHRRNYYLKEIYLASYSEQDLQEINCFLDLKVISLLNYERKGNL